MANKEIDIPSGLSEDELVEFIRDEVRKVGGDPDTMYPIDYGNYYNTSSEGDHTVVPVLESFEVKFNYDNYIPSKVKLPQNPPYKGVEITIIEDERDKNYRSAREVIDEWSKFIKESEHVSKDR